MQPMAASFVELLCLEVPEHVCIHLSGQFSFLPVPAPCAGPGAVSSWSSPVGCAVESACYCARWWPCSGFQLTASFAFGGRKLPLSAMICLIQASKQSQRGRPRVCEELICFPFFLITVHLFALDQRQSPGTPKGGFHTQVLGTADTSHVALCLRVA